MAEAIKRRDYQEWLQFCDQIQNSTGINVNETSKEQKARKKKVLGDYNNFTKTYFPAYADHDCAPFQIDAADAALDDKNIFAIWEWAREHAKSVHACVILPMFLIAHEELTGMILMGKNNTDACNLLSDIQAQLQYNELFAHDFGQQYNSGDWQDGEFTTKGGVRFLAVGRDQSPRGARKGEKRPNYAVIDDIDDDIIIHNQKRVKAVVKRILGALYFALATKGARLIVAGNRIHPQSILAHLVGDTKPGMPKREGIYHSKVCAIENGKPAWDRYTLEELELKIKKAGSVQAGIEYFHTYEVDGDIFKDDDIIWKKLPPLKDYTVIIGYFDPSYENNAKSDFKAVRVWGAYNAERHCIKSFVRRCELTEAFEFMIRYEKSLPPGVGVVWYVEKQFLNRPIRNALKRVRRDQKHNLQVMMDPRDKENKYTRMVKMQPRYSTRDEVFYNIEERHNPDMLTGNNQLKGIEPGYSSPDDSPDADEGAWYYIDPHMPDENWQPVIGKRQHKNSW